MEELVDEVYHLMCMELVEVPRSFWDKLLLLSTWVIELLADALLVNMREFNY